MTENEIDEQVVAHADDDTAWETPVRVLPGVASSFSIPANLAARAAFLARLHHGSLEDWLTRIIQERVELEEGAYAEAKLGISRAR